jgi:hypothetical protein
VISARVVGIDIDCLIDTGGESSLLPKEFLRHFPQRAEKIITDSNGQRRVYEVGPAEVVVGKTLIGKFPFVVVGDYLQLTRGKEVWDANGPSLGINILGNFRIRIDGPKGRMTLSRDDGPLEGSGWIAYTGFNGTPHQTVEAKTVAGEKLRLFLDTGYVQSRIIKRLCGPKETPLQLVVGETRVEGPAMVLEGDSDLRFSSQGKEDIIIHATLGWDILRDLVMELSPKNKQLRLSKGK